MKKFLLIFITALLCLTLAACAIECVHNDADGNGVCDACGGKLVQRHDDESEVVRARLEIYHQQTEPLKDFYAERGLLRAVENRATVEEMSEAILRTLGR